MATYNPDNDCYEFSFSSGIGEACIALTSEEVEQAVAEKVLLEPRLDGEILWLKMISPGDGFARVHEGCPGVSILELVTDFVRRSDMKIDCPDEYPAAVLDLYMALKLSANVVWDEGRRIGAIGDPFDGDNSMFSSLNAKLEELGVR